MRVGSPDSPLAMRSSAPLPPVVGVLILLTINALSMRASASGGDAEAYERAHGLREIYADKVLQGRLEPHWIEGGQRFWFVRDTPDGHQFDVVEVASGESEPLFDHATLAERLAALSGESVSAAKLPFRRLQWSQEKFSFRCFERQWDAALPDLTLKKGEATERPNEEGDRGRRGRDGSRRGNRSPQETVSPDKRHAAFIRNHNVYVRQLDDGEVIQLSQDGAEGHGYGWPILWAPNSKRVAVWKTKRGEERLVHYIDSSPEDQVQPKHFTRSYAKPGDVIDTRSPHVFTVGWRSRHTAADESLFPNPFIMRNLAWLEDQVLRFEYVERGFGVHRVLELDTASGRTRVIVDESSETFVDVHHKGFRRDLEDSEEILWTSERDGWNHLYLIDGRTGNVRRQLTKGPWVVRRVDHVDEERREVIISASGYYPDQDPYFLHYFRVHLDRGGVVPLTESDGQHQLSWAPDRRHYIATWSRVDQPPVHELRAAVDGRLIATIAKADHSRLLEAGWTAPEVFVSKDRDGAFDIWGLIFRPSNFDPEASYPVIEQIYAGPHSAFVPKSFRSYFGMQSIAELGFIVVKIDGKGTSHRSRAFHHFCHKNLGDSGFPDRIAWMRAAAERVPQMDLERVGIYGGSAGGQSALRALLAHGDFYKAAAADCGCHDNRMDKIWWNELWMDWPVGPHYEEQSNVTQAHRLEGKLLLTVGELDTNVDPASTMQVVSALIKADKDFEMLVIPGANHGVGEAPYAARRRMDFFVRHLLGEEPRR